MSVMFPSRVYASETYHFFSYKGFRKRNCVLQVAETQENATETDVCFVFPSFRVGSMLIHNVFFSCALYCICKNYLSRYN